MVGAASDTSVRRCRHDELRQVLCRLPSSSAGREPSHPTLGLREHVDPWTCHHDSDVSAVAVDAYRDAALALLCLGYTPAPNIPVMRGLWRRNEEDRDLVRSISSRWEVAA